MREVTGLQLLRVYKDINKLRAIREGSEWTSVCCGGHNRRIGRRSAGGSLVAVSRLPQG